MKRKFLTLLAASTLAAGVPAIASAQPAAWNVNERQDSLDARIDAGIRSGQLTRAEADRLRGEFRDISRLEAQYRMNGLDRNEVADLDARFDRLSAQIRVERADNQGRGDGRGRGGNTPAAWNINERQAQLDQRIDVGVRNGQLTRAEADRLRAEFRTIANLEAQYRVNGLDRNEVADLDARFDRLSAQIRVERADNQGRGDGRGRGDNSPAAWNINERQAQLDQRIDVGVRNGQLTRAEADRLRAEFREIARIEMQYRVNGLDYREVADLDARFDRLSAQIRTERADYQGRDGRGYNGRDGRGDNRGGYDNRRNGRWENLNQRQAEFRQRLRRAVNDRRITQRQSDYLRAQFDQIARIERDYRRDGLSNRERADLDRRMDTLQMTFRQQIQANQYAYGYGQAPNLFDYLFGIR